MTQFKLQNKSEKEADLPEQKLQRSSGHYLGEAGQYFSRYAFNYSNIL